MSLKSCLCLSFQSDNISKWQNVLGLIACYSWVNFTLHMFDLAWSIHRKYRPNKMRHALTPLSDHCKFQRVPHASKSHSIAHQLKLSDKPMIPDPPFHFFFLFFTGEKIMLAIITKMTLTQVSTWFANARRRLKKENKMTWSPRWAIWWVVGPVDTLLWGVGFVYNLKEMVYWSIWTV